MFLGRLAQLKLIVIACGTLFGCINHRNYLSSLPVREHAHHLSIRFIWISQFVVLTRILAFETILMSLVIETGVFRGEVGRPSIRIHWRVLLLTSSHLLLRATNNKLVQMHWAHTYKLLFAFSLYQIANLSFCLLAVVWIHFSFIILFYTCLSIGLCYFQWITFACVNYCIIDC